MTPVPPDPLIGQTLDERYLIRSRIARGGMAMVYLADDKRLQRRVAVKVMHEHLAEDDNFTRRFEQEARSAAGLSHPNLVNIHDQGHDAGRTYLVMEYLPSITLRALLKQQKRLTTEQAIEIGEAVLSGLAAAHQAGIVHRDLKPENVMLADDGRIKLGDFGLARSVHANTTTGQALLGTIAYLSPELVTRGIADERSDLYAFGIMLYEMLTGVQPFTGDQPMQIAYQHAHSEVPVPSLKSTESTPELDELVRWTTQRDPADRPRDATEALDYLRGLGLSEPPTGATRVLPGLGDSPTPSTAVLDGVQQQALAAELATEPEDDPSSEDEAAAPSPLEQAAGTAQHRERRGRAIAAIVVLAVVLAGGIGWWFGQGPGSQVSVPDVAGVEMPDAEAMLQDRTFVVDVFECSSLEVEAGLAAVTEPEAGARLDRGSEVRLCRSTGPEMLAVPTLAGKTREEAEQIIEEARFSLGEVDERFTDEIEQGEVIDALGSDGEQLGSTYPERAPISLVVSAGPLPDVVGQTRDEAIGTLEEHGLSIDDGEGREAFDDEAEAGRVLALVPLGDPVRPGDAVALDVSRGPLPDVRGDSVADATKRLADADLSIDESLGGEEHHDDVPEGHVIGLVPGSETVRPGDAVGLTVSLGPELFEVPDVSGMNVGDAFKRLEDAGFSPQTGMLEILWDVASVTSTEPEAGSMQPRGTSITVRATITL